MITVDLSNRVGSAVRKYVVEELHLRVPVPMWTLLFLREHEGFAGVEAAVDTIQRRVLFRNVKNPRKSE